MLITINFKLPYAAPSTGIFIENSPLGARHGCRALPTGQEPHLATRDENVGAQEVSGIWAAFSLDTFFWPRKRKYPAFGCGNPIKNNCRNRDTKTYVHQTSCS